MSGRFPKKLFHHLKENGAELLQVEAGIWYMNVKEEVNLTLNMPIQFIVTSQLSEKENFWLKNLTNNLQDERIAKKLIEFYKEHEDDIHYKSVMDVIMRANKKLFQKGDKDMCDAIECNW